MADDVLWRRVQAERTRCTGSTCHRLIVWAYTEAGKRQPVDAEPTPDGNLVLYTDDHGRLRTRVHGGPLLDPVPELWMPHHATCPNVAEFR